MKKIIKNIILLSAIFSVFAFNAQAQAYITSTGTSIAVNGEVFFGAYSMDNGAGSVYSVENSYSTFASSFTGVGKVVYKNASIISESFYNEVDLSVNFKKNSLNLFSVPVNISVNNIKNLNGLFIKRYNSSTNKWVPVLSDNSFDQGAYSIQNSGDESDKNIIGILSYSSSVQSVPDDGKWILIGNPFLATFDLSKMLLGQNIQETFYFWNGTNYLYFNTGSSERFSGLSDLGKTDALLLPFQAFFVRNNGKRNDFTRVFMNTENLSHDKAKKDTKSGNDYSEFQYLKLSANGNGISDPTVVLFYENAEDNADGTYDAWKMISHSNGVPQIFTSSPDGADLAVNVMKNYKTEMQIPLNFTSNKDGKYSIKLEGSGKLDNIYVYDSKTAETYNLTEQNSFDIDYKTSDKVNRFTIFFEKSALSEIANVEPSENNFNVYAFDKTVNVETKNLGNRQIQVSIYDAIGRLVVSEKMTSDHSTFQSDFRQASYFVKITENGKTFIKQVIIN